MASSEDSQAKTPSKLDSLGKEEIIKILKRQMLASQKNRTKTEELENEVKLLKANLDTKVLVQNELNSFKKENEKLKTLLEEYEKKNKNSTGLESKFDDSKIKETENEHENLRIQEKEINYMKEKLRDWEELMLMMEEERKRSIQHLQILSNKLLLLQQNMNNLLVTMETAVDNKDEVCDLVNDKTIKKEKEDDDDDVVGKRVTELEGKMRRARSLIEGLVFEKEEICGKVEHLVELIEAEKRKEKKEKNKEKEKEENDKEIKSLNFSKNSSIFVGKLESYVKKFLKIVKEEKIKTENNIKKEENLVAIERVQQVKSKQPITVTVYEAVHDEPQLKKTSELVHQTEPFSFTNRTEKKNQKNRNNLFLQSNMVDSHSQTINIPTTQSVNFKTHVFPTVSSSQVQTDTFTNHKNTQYEMFENIEKYNNESEGSNFSLKNIKDEEKKMKREEENEENEEEIIKKLRLELKDKEEREGKLKQLALKQKKDSLQLKSNLERMEEKWRQEENVKNQLLSQLENTKKEMQQKQLGLLEIEDYERSLKQMTCDLDEKVSIIDNLEIQVQEYKRKIIYFNDLLDKEKKEIEDERKKREDLQNQLNQSLSNEKRRTEEVKILEERFPPLQGAVANLQEENKRLLVHVDKLNNQSEAYISCNQKQMNSLKDENEKLNEEIKKSVDSYTRLSLEFEGYKVRVHSVLKQKKEQLPSNQQYQQNLEETIKLKKELKERLEKTSRELEDLKENKILLEKMLEEDKINSQLLIGQLENEVEFYKNKYQSLVGNFEKEKKELKSKLVILEDKQRKEINQIKFEHQTLIDKLTNQLEKKQLEFDHLKLKKNLEGRAKNKNTPRLDEREDAEGSEFSPYNSIYNYGNLFAALPSSVSLTSSSSFYISNSSSFGSTLSSSTSVFSYSNQTTFPSYSSNSNSHFLNSFLNLPKTLKQEEKVVDVEREIENKDSTYCKQTLHLRQLLNESEANVIRLTEQASILKEEIRRMERNEQRNNNLSNMEYLKNIIFKFLTLRTSQERLHLVPVIETMLKLSPEEKALLTSVANGFEHGGEVSGQSSSHMSGWSSYLNIWSSTPN